MRTIHLFLALLLLAAPAQAAIITGTVYDYGLQPVPGAVVQINTTPQQTMVAREGTYRLEVPAGSYQLSVSKADATGLEEKAEMDIIVPEQGTYTYDLILFQELQEFEEPDLGSLEEEEQTTISPLILLLILGLVIAAGVAVVVRMKRNIEREIAAEDDLEAQVLAIVAHEKRITQKDLRQRLPHSEAAVSLAVTSLEHKGTLTKIKKGRSNVIIHNKQVK